MFIKSETDREIEAYKLGLERDAAVLGELIKSSAWETYYRLGISKLEACRSAVLMGTKEEFEYRKGLYEGIRQMLNLPEDIIEERNRMREH